MQTSSTFLKRNLNVCISGGNYFLFCFLFVFLCCCVCFSILSTLQMSHNAVGAFCRSVKLQCELYPSREVAICLDPYCGLGFVLWCLCRWSQRRDLFIQTSAPINTWSCCLEVSHVTYCPALF